MASLPLAVPAIRKHVICLTFLILPAASIPIFVSKGGGSHPLVNFLFLLAVAFAAWWAGTSAGVLVSACAIPVYALVVSRGHWLYPRNLNLTLLLILFGVALGVGQMARGRKRTEELLRFSNELLEKRVAERTEELEQARGHLQQNNEELRHFAYAVSHDLQQPLRSIAMSAQLLQRTVPGSEHPDAAMLIDGIVASALRLDTMVRELLEYTRVLGERTDRIVPARVEEALKAVLASISSDLDAESATVTLYGDAVVAMNAVHVQQLLQNLICNSLKYRSEAPPAISVKVERVPDAWRISVADNGIGIDRAYYEKIFEPFSRLHNRQDYPGAGLGLALCRRVVQRYGGRIWVESERGKGSTFYFTVPAENS